MLCSPHAFPKVPSYWNTDPHLLGPADREYVNVHGLRLEHGRRYLVCVHADNTTLEYERWTQTLPAVSACSDGVVVDLTPPSPGAVWIGQEQPHPYQVGHEEDKEDVKEDVKNEEEGDEDEDNEGDDESMERERGEQEQKEEEGQEEEDE